MSRVRSACVLRSFGRPLVRSVGVCLSKLVIQEMRWAQGRRKSMTVEAITSSDFVASVRARDIDVRARGPSSSTAVIVHLDDEIVTTAAS